MSISQLKDLLGIAVEAAIEAGREIMCIYDNPSQDFGIERKADNSPLTLADKAAHNCILRHLEPTGIPILSEEGAHLPYEERQAWHRAWVVDPLDGTKEFIKKNGEFTVNIGLVEDGAPILGVIYVPATGVLYVGKVCSKPSLKGEAYRFEFPSSEGNRLSVAELLGNVSVRGQESERVCSLPLREGWGRSFTIVASRSHMSPETEEYINQMRQKHGDIQLVSSGSSLKMCLVAEGTADVYPRFAPTMEWDTAAGDAIARAAGKMVMDARTDQPLTYNKPDLHNPWFIVQ